MVLPLEKAAITPKSSDDSGMTNGTSTLAEGCMGEAALRISVSNINSEALELRNTEDSSSY
jgi:hypothetical protein